MQYTLTDPIGDISSRLGIKATIVGYCRGTGDWSHLSVVLVSLSGGDRVCWLYNHGLKGFEQGVYGEKAFSEFETRIRTFCNS